MKYSNGTTEHTAGPWIVRGEPEGNDAPMGLSPDNERGGHNWPFFIRQDREFPVGQTPLWLAHGIQDRQDAQLMAASPELLAALVDAEFLMRQAGKHAGPMQDSFNRSAADARAAIAKATQN